MHKVSYQFSILANPNPNLTGPSMPQYGNYPNSFNIIAISNVMYDTGVVVVRAVF